MGIQTDLKYVGRKKNIIYYKRGKQFLMRMAPVTVVQTEPTKASAKVFGRAVKMAASLRRALAPLLPDPKDRKMQFRLNDAFAKWIKQQEMGITNTDANNNLLSEFSFNEKISLRERWKMPLKVDWAQEGIAVLGIPAFYSKQSVSAPAGSKEVHLSMMLISIETVAPYTAVSTQALLHLAVNGNRVEKNEMRLPYSAGKNCLHIVVAALQFLPDSAVRKQPAWRPAQIIGILHN